MTFPEAEAYLESTINEARSRHEPYRLDRMRAFLRELGDPQNTYPTLHVGGTSGKGSTSTMLAAILQADGRRVGLHTKPHVTSITERARIDGLPISEERFAALLSSMLPAVERVAGAHGRPSYYETTLALAFQYFAEERVDFAVIEVGIGGKLDGTNIIVPEVSVITTIGYDHTEILGNTLEEIAGDKAGIAKPGVPLVSAVADPGARRVIEARCREVGSPFVSVLDTVSIETLESSEPRFEKIADANTMNEQRFTVKTPAASYTIALPMLGNFQRLNAATAIRTIESMRLPVAPAIMERGLARVHLDGRMEYFPGEPGVVFDIAHNPEKAASLIASLAEHFPGKMLVFVVAVSESKDAREILRALARANGTYIFSRFHATGKRAIDPVHLVQTMAEFGVSAKEIADLEEAFHAALTGAGANALVVVTGSTFIVAELREQWERKRENVHV